MDKNNYSSHLHILKPSILSIRKKITNAFFYSSNSLFLDELIAADSPCGDWEPYKDEKCFKIFDKVGLQSYEDAEKTCQQQEN